jgi:hypothetical protein
MSRTALCLFPLAALLPAQLADPAAANPEVAPGLVRWHADLAHAKAAAAASRRPVLLFQLLGRLDREFC